METFRCYKIGFFLTNIGVFVLVRIVSLCRISKWPRLDWKMQKIVHFGNLSWNNGQIQWIWCLSRNKLFLTMWEVKFATKVCNIMNYSPNTPTLMFNWCINCFDCKLHLQFVSLLFLTPTVYIHVVHIITIYYTNILFHCYIEWKSIHVYGGTLYYLNCHDV